MNDEKRHKNLEADITIYKSLIVAAGILAVIVLLTIAYKEKGLGPLGFYFFILAPIVFFAFVVILLKQVIDLFGCSRLGRRRLLTWYACLFVMVLAADSLSGAQSDFIFAIAPVVLLILPVVWVRKASRS